MAQYNEVLSGRFNQLLTKLFSMKGGAPAPQLSPEIQPVISIGELQGDLHYLADERMCASGITATGDATHPGIVQLVNKVPGVIGTIEFIVLTFTAAGIWTIRTGATERTPSGVTRFRDSRIAGTPALNTAVAADQVASGNTLSEVAGVANSTVIVPVEIVMTNKSVVEVVSNSNTARVSAGFFWVERRVEPSELV